MTPLFWAFAYERSLAAGPLSWVQFSLQAVCNWFDFMLICHFIFVGCQDVDIFLNNKAVF